MIGTILKNTHLICLFILIFIDYTQALTVDKVLAIVNDEIITLSDYKIYVSKLDSVEDRETVDKKILKGLIEERIILQEARQKGIDATSDEIEENIQNFLKRNNLSSEEFERMLTKEGVSISEYRTLLEESLISLRLIDEEVKSKVIVTDEDIENFYENNKHLFQEGQEKVLVKAIFLRLNNSPSITEITDLKIKTLKIYSDLKNGEQFDKMVGLYSDEPVKSRNGLLGEFEKGGMIPALEKEISTMKENDVSVPIWTEEGIYILKLVKRTEASFSRIERERDDIYQILHEQKKREQFNEWMKSLWEKSAIKIKVP